MFPSCANKTNAAPSFRDVRPAVWRHDFDNYPGKIVGVSANTSAVVVHFFALTEPHDVQFKLHLEISIVNQ